MTKSIGDWQLDCERLQEELRSKEKLWKRLEVQVLDSLRQLVEGMRGMDTRLDRKLDEIGECLATGSYSGRLDALLRQAANMVRFNKTSLRPEAGVVKGPQPAQDESGGSVAGEVDASILPKLVSLVDRMDPPAELREKVAKLSARLKAASAQEADLVELLGEFGGLSLEINQAHKRAEDDIARFLNSVNSKLQAFKNHLHGNAEDAASANDDADAMRASISTQMSTMRADMAAARNLGELKSSLESSLENLDRDLGGFLDRQQDRIQAVQARSDGLMNLLVDTQAETTRLRNQISALRRQAPRDKTTGLPDVAALLQRMEEELERSKRYRSELTVMAIDLDSVDELKRRHGADVADKLLYEVGNRLQESQREHDFVARGDGADIVVLLPRTGLRDAGTVANNVSRRVKALRCSYGGQAIPLTISIGVATARFTDDVRSALARANEQLASAKGEGTGHVSVVDSANA